MLQKRNIPEDIDPKAPLYTAYQVFNETVDMCMGARRYSHELLMQLVRDNEDTEFGKKYGFKEIRSVEDYKKRVPLSSYDDYAVAIERMVKGEKNLITAYPVVHYALTSGSVDNPKNIPVSSRTMEAYMKYASNLSSCIYDFAIRERKGRSPKQGKQFLTAVVKTDYTPDGTLRGPISSAIYLQNKAFMHYILPWPVEVMYPEGHSLNQKYLRAFYALKERGITRMVAPFMTALVDSMYYIESNWRSLVGDIEAGRLDDDVDMDDGLREKFNAQLAPDPERAAELRAIFEQGFEEPVIPKIWPDCDFIASIGGGGFAAYTKKMKRYSGDIPMYFNCYGASEGPIATILDFESVENTLIPANGFFEFLPVEEDGSDPTRTLGLDELEVGHEYEIIVTNLAGFYRYRIGDVIEVAGYDGQSPRLLFKYRKNQMISIAGEKTNEAGVAWVVHEFEKETGESITDFSIYADTDDLPGRYVLFLEPERHLPREEHERYRAICDEKMGIANPSYGSKVKEKLLLPLKLNFLQQETYYLYRDMMMMRGISENQIKPVRVLDTPRKEKFFFGLIDKE